MSDIRVGPGITLGLGTKINMDLVYFPTNSVIPYYGASITDPDWDYYSAPVGCHILGTTNSSLVETTLTKQTPVSVVTAGTTGAHNSFTTFQSGTNFSVTGSFSNSSNNSAGAHGHNGFMSHPNIALQTSSFRFLRANKNARRLPSDTVAFRNSVIGSYGERFKPLTTGNNTNYLVGAISGGTTTQGQSSESVSVTSSSAGSHQHHINDRARVTTAFTRPYAIASGTHTHFMSATLFQSIVNNTAILHAWQSASARVPESDVVVMYTGNPAALPNFWKLCDGNNGTINMNGFYAAFDPTNDSVTWYTIRNNNAAITASTINDAPNDAAHTHSDGLPQGGNGVQAQHTNQSWPHTHGKTASVSSSLIPVSIYLYFIQFKG
jgi:hypothetical protein